MTWLAVGLLAGLCLRFVVMIVRERLQPWFDADEMEATIRRLEDGPA